jgi:hypothetical protein
MPIVSINRLNPHGQVHFVVGPFSFPVFHFVQPSGRSLFSEKCFRRLSAVYLSSSLSNSRFIPEGLSFNIFENGFSLAQAVFSAVLSFILRPQTYFCLESVFLSALQ